MAIAISTIIPTVARPTLERAVTSALAQDLSPDDHEIIVVNDTGAPLAPAIWMKASRVVVLTTRQRERCVARNTGAAVARGQYLHFLDDDDYLLPGGLGHLLAAARSTGSSWVYGALERMDDKGRPGTVDRPAIRGNILVDLIAGETLHLGPSLIAADAFFAAGGFDPAFMVRQDLELELRLALLHDVERTDALVVRVRVGPKGATTTRWSEAKERSRAVRDKALGAPGTLARLFDSAGADPFLRGRAARAYAISAALLLGQGRIAEASLRIWPLLRLCALHPLRPQFWEGARLRPGMERRRPDVSDVRGARPSPRVSLP